MKKIRILENDHVYNEWSIQNKEGSKCTSKLRRHQTKSNLDMYHKYDVYSHAKVPYDIREVSEKTYLDMPPHEAIPKAFSDEVCSALKQDYNVLITSGYCAYAPAIIGGMQRAYGEDAKIGIIWIDAHFDNEILDKKDTFPVTFVGIPLSTICGQTMQTWGKSICGIRKWIPGENIIASDGRLSDYQSRMNLKEAHIKWLDENQFDDSFIWSKEINQLAHEIDYFYIMIDADILLQEFIPAYYEKEPGGHDLKILLRNLQVVLNTGKVKVLSCFCFDFDLYDKGGIINSETAMKIVEEVLKEWS